MRYIEALDIYNGKEKSIFLAGGITGCKNWQKEAVEMLKDLPIVLFNPRRKNFPIHNPDAAKEQIIWEYNHLRKANAISFWFPEETICPIVLYELGAWSMRKKPLFIGVHPNYSRRQDVEIQTQLARPDIQIQYSLEDLSDQIKEWLTLPTSLLTFPKKGRGFSDRGS